MRILWVSNSPHDPSGYGQQTRLTVQKLRAFHDVHIWATNSSSWIHHLDGIPIYRARSAARDPLGGLSEATEELKPDLVLFLGDPWCFSIREFERVAKLAKLAVWMPIDCDPFPAPNLPLAELADYVISMNQHGCVLMKRLGLSSLHHIPHAIDTKVFTPNPECRADPPVVGMVQANFGTRKLIALQLEAFSLARERLVTKPDLYYHGNLQGTGGLESSDYTGLIDYFDITDCVYVNREILPRLTPEQMAFVYNRFSLLLHTTAGEGFGVPVLEAMACGVPAITTDNSAMKYVNPYIKVKPSVREYIGQMQAFHSWPTAEDVADAIVEHFVGKYPRVPPIVDLANGYDIDNVYNDQWAPFLDFVDSEPVKRFS